MNIASEHLQNMEGQEAARKEAYLEEDYDSFDRITEDMLQLSVNTTRRMRELLETGTDPGPAENKPISGWNGHRPLRGGATAVSR